jgi:hypothetical protein
VEVVEGVKISYLPQSPPVAIAKNHRLGDLNSRHLFLTVLEVQDQGQVLLVSLSRACR